MPACEELNRLIRILSFLGGRDAWVPRNALRAAAMGDLAGSPCKIVAVHLYGAIEFRPNEIGLAAKARLSDDLLQNPRLNRQRSRAAITTHIESRKRK